MTLIHILLFIAFVSYLLYTSAALRLWTLALPGYLLFLTVFSNLSFLPLLLMWLIAGGVLYLLNTKDLRMKFLTSRAFDFAKGQLPTISASEREALQAGTVSLDGELFSGKPDWDKLFSYAPLKLSDEEQAFLDGPVNDLCDNKYTSWDMWHKDLAFKPDLLKKVEKDGYLGMIIPKEYGGLDFSVLATWQIVMKVGGTIGPVATHIGISNSIGAAELIERYGTDKQKKHFLPRLADGREVACFALTSPIAGSDATSIEDYGVVEEGTYKGKKVLGVRLNFSKRYMTMGPLATLASLAFKLYDPKHLLSDEEDRGVTLALVPTDTPGFDNSRRHYPIGQAFPNGPLIGKDVFIPMDNILGGPDRIGRAWEMLSQVLATGRATSLPTSAAGTAKAATYFTAVYAGIRKQFGVNIGAFQAVQEKIAEQAGLTYMLDATRLMTFSQIQAGERPAIPAAISKYNSTEYARQVATIGVDVLAGKGVMQGPSNPVGALYTGAPMPVTVEGANIMTRGLIVFGQGSVRCHPYILKEMKALEDNDKDAFDELVMKHAGFVLTNHARAFWLGLSRGKLASVTTPNPAMKSTLQHLTRLSASFALLTDVSMILLGGKLKFMESLSGKFADALSHMYMAASVVKQYEDQGRPDHMMPIVEWCIAKSLHTSEQSLYDILENFPVRPVAWWLKVFIFPLGRQFEKPKDSLAHKVAKLVQDSREVREKLADGMYLERTKTNPFNMWEEALDAAKSSKDIDKVVRKAKKAGELKGYTYLQQVDEALKKKLINKTEHKTLLQAHEKIMDVINVDDFSFEELMAQK